ncbi:translesion DNA synthesis-associated protein ImuA [Ramlibacter sp. PS3R-8]|uniref:translesion DNA synthesis-associated protein ImuA n=1 Tax=Ramlibacter sp. PS3R-8 TaxID=3133437 RepID=UPI00309FEEBF
MTASASSAQALQFPHVWRGRELAQAQEKTLSTGHDLLDAQLPGKGWPVGNLVEVLQQEAQHHVWQLVGPGLSSCMAQGAGPAVLVNAPYQPFGPSLRAQGIIPEQLLCVQADKVSSTLWSAEQALRCADVSAVLAWLPQARSEDLRRLQLCAQAGEKLLFVFRPLICREQSTPARLRLQVDGIERMEVQILKRRGPPLLQPLELHARPRRLAALLNARKSHRELPLSIEFPSSESHVLDRTPSFAG